MKYNVSEMMCLDIYLSSLTNKEYKEIKHATNTIKTSPLISWDIITEEYNRKISKLKIAKDINVVKQFAKKQHWKNEIDAIFENEDFEALIITDFHQKILWVNDGFTKMTGYSKKYALAKTPNFLQGIETSAQVKKQIRNNLNDLKPFTKVITNYRKDKTPYECEVKIIPMYADHVTHFLAIEKEVI